MATSTVTAEVNSSAIPPSIASSSTPAAPAESSASTPTTGSTTSSVAPSEGAQQEELSPQDFGSLEDYAKALLEKKQSAGNTQPSETPGEEGAEPEAAAVAGE